MNTQPVNTERSIGLTVSKHDMLNLIGNALKFRWISFSAATKLRDLVRLGRVDDAEVDLRRYQHPHPL